MLLKRGTEVWERVVSGNFHKNPKWRSKKRERERRRQRNEFVPWLKSGGDEVANQTHILRLRFEQVVCFLDIQPVSFMHLSMLSPRVGGEGGQTQGNLTF